MGTSRPGRTVPTRRRTRGYFNVIFNFNFNFNLFYEFILNSRPATTSSCGRRRLSGRRRNRDRSSSARGRAKRRLDFDPEKKIDFESFHYEAKTPPKSSSNPASASVSYKTPPKSSSKKETPVSSETAPAVSSKETAPVSSTASVSSKKETEKTPPQKIQHASAFSRIMKVKVKRNIKRKTVSRRKRTSPFSSGDGRLVFFSFIFFCIQPISIFFQYFFRVQKRLTDYYKVDKVYNEVNGVDSDQEDGNMYEMNLDLILEEEEAYGKVKKYFAQLGEDATCPKVTDEEADAYYRLVLEGDIKLVEADADGCFSMMEKRHIDIMLENNQEKKDVKRVWRIIKF